METECRALAWLTEASQRNRMLVCLTECRGVGFANSSIMRDKKKRLNKMQGMHLGYKPKQDV